MQVVVIDPQLKNQSGHQFLYTLALQAELERRRIPAIILGNISADKHCLNIKNFYSSLTDITSEIFKIGPTLSIFYKTCVFIKLLRDQLDNFFFKQSDFKIQKSNIFFLHSLYIFELLSFGLFLKKRAKIFIDNNHKIVIGFNFTYKRRSLVGTLLFAFLYKYIFMFLIKDLHSRVIYFCDGEPLRRDYEQLLKNEVHILPLPVRNQFLDFYINKAKEDINKNNIIVSYVGGARYNKGFDILIKMLVDLLNKEEATKKLSFFIQVDTHRQQLEKDRRIVLEAVRVLGDLTNKFRNIKLIYGALSTEKYYDLLSESNILVLPYREDFKHLPSGIFREAIILGKIPLVANNTTMAYELLRHNLNDLIFNLKDTKSFISTIEKVINNIEDYKIKIINLQKNWLNFYSVTNLVDQLFILTA